MTQPSERASRPVREDEPPATEETQSDHTDHRAAEVSASAKAFVDDLNATLDEYDQSLREELFEPGEVVTPEELTKRIEKKNREFIQKGGQ